MRIIEKLSELDKEWFGCGVVGCQNKADYIVTDDTKDGEGYICKNCNDEDNQTGEGWTYGN